MARVVPVERERHAGRGWRRPNGYGFVAAETVIPLGGSEFALAVPAMPIGFVERSPGRYLPVALLAIAKGRNAFVGPTGQWLGGYIPALLRAYPFSIIRPAGSEKGELCVDEDSGLMVDDAGVEGAERFFEEDGTPTASTTALTEFLRRLERDQTITDLAVATLADAGVIKPWELTVPIGKEQVTVNGLSRVDEAALNALDDPTFLKLRKASALVIAHGQLLSMGQTSVLTRLTALQQQLMQATQKGPPEQLPV